MIKRFWNWLTSLEEINGRGRCPTYLYRRTFLRLPWFAVYLHHFVGDDWSRDLHDHPKRFISIGLKGRYVEQTPMKPDESLDATISGYAPERGCWTYVTEKTYIAPWIRTFPANHIHRLRLVDGKPCWTLVIVLRPVRDWGFWHLGKWIHWREYVKGDVADKMKSCPD